MTIKRKAMTMRVKADPHAYWATLGYGEVALAKITVDSAVFAPLNTFGFVASTTKMVNSSGAVSPAARATASRAPLTIPPTAAGRTTVRVTRDFVAPSA